MDCKSSRSAKLKLRSQYFNEISALLPALSPSLPSILPSPSIQASQLVLVISLYHRNCPEAREHPISGTESHMLWTLVDSDTPSIPLSLSLCLSSYPSLPSSLPLHVYESGFLSSLLVEVYAPIPDHQDVQGEWVSVSFNQANISADIVQYNWI